MANAEENNKIFNILLKHTSKIDMLMYQLCTMEVSRQQNKPEFKEYLEQLKNEIDKMNSIYKKNIFNEKNTNTIYKELSNKISVIPKPYNRGYIRMILELENAIEKECFLTYDRDIMNVAFHLLDQSIANLPNDELRAEIIKYKYDIAMRCPNITQDCINNEFNFDKEIYDCSDLVSTLRNNRLNPYENYSLEQYARSVIELHGMKLLEVTDEDFRKDFKIAAEAMFDYYMIASAISFLPYELDAEFFEELIKKHNIVEETYSTKLLRTLLGSKKNTRKRVYKVSFFPFGK